MPECNIQTTSIRPCLSSGDDFGNGHGRIFCNLSAVTTPLIKVFATILLFAAMVCSSVQAQDPAIVAIRALTDPAKTVTLKDPRACNDRLLKVIYWLHAAQTAQMAPEAILEVSLVPQPHRELVKNALLRNLVISERLGLLTPENLEAMKRGKSPSVTLGPYAGEVAEVDHILPIAKFPEHAKQFWNLELMPKTLNRMKGDKVGQRQLDLLKRVGEA